MLLLYPGRREWYNGDERKKKALYDHFFFFGPAVVSHIVPSQNPQDFRRFRHPDDTSCPWILYNNIRVYILTFSALSPSIFSPKKERKSAAHMKLISHHQRVSLALYTTHNAADFMLHALLSVVKLPTSHCYDN